MCHIMRAFSQPLSGCILSASRVAKAQVDARYLAARWALVELKEDPSLGKSRSDRVNVSLGDYPKMTPTCETRACGEG